MGVAEVLPALWMGAAAGFDEVDEDGEGVTSGEEEPPPPELFAVGVTAFDALDETEFPRAFVATAVNVYEVPPVRPVIVHEVVLTEHVRPSGLEVTV